MNLVTVKVVRIYLSEGDGQLDSILSKLKKMKYSRGASVFRATSGFGPSGVTHEASIMDLSLNLPLVIEFFDEPEIVEQLLEEIKDNINAEHVLIWTAEMMV